MHIKVTVSNLWEMLQPTQKNFRLYSLIRENFLAKKSQIFWHFSPTATFHDKILYQTNTFLQTEAKVELGDKFLEWRFNS